MGLVQREIRGGWKIEEGSWIGRPARHSRVLGPDPGRSTGQIPTSIARDSGSGVTEGAEVESGEEFPGQNAPVQGFGAGAGSDFDPSRSSRIRSPPIVGRSAGWTQPARAVVGANRLVARSVKDAPTNAVASRLSPIVRMESPKVGRGVDPRKG